MEPSDMRLLSEDQQRELKEYENLFGSSAWVRLAREARSKASILRAQAINSASIEVLAQLRGRIEVLEYYADLDKVVEAQYQSYVDDAVQAREEAAESRASAS